MSNANYARIAFIYFSDCTTPDHAFGKRPRNKPDALLQSCSERALTLDVCLAIDGFPHRLCSFYSDLRCGNQSVFGLVMVIADPNAMSGLSI